MSSSLQPFKLPKLTNGYNYNAVDPLDVRYFDDEVAQYLSERSRVAYQAHVEAALAHALADFKICSQAVAEEIEVAASKVTIEEVYEEESKTKHDIKAVVNCIKKQISDKAKPYVHFGATSYDIVATAQALQLRSAIQDVVLPRNRQLIKTLIDLSTQYASTAQIGRTHGQHGVPVTFGFAMAEYVERLGASTIALEALSNELVGKFSGAVGAYNGLSVFVDDPLAFEEAVLAKVNLKPAPYSTQIVPPEYVIRLIDELAITGGIMANLAHDMRHLQRSEINEVRERFEKGQTGSSTMAHKRNPWNFENVISMNKQLLSQTLNANLNIASEHQRDLTDSASARFYGTALALVASMTARLNRIMQKIEIDEAAMQRNLTLTDGAIAAEPLYLLLEKHGHTAAHEKAKALAHRALEQGLSLAEAIQKDKEANSYWQKFSDHERQIIEQPEQHYTGLAAKKAQTIAAKWGKFVS